MKERKCCLTFISGFLIMTGAVIVISSFWVHSMILRKILDLTPGELLYDEWIKPAPPMSLDIYFFNWTNPEEFYDDSKKPAVTEVGPFTFDVRVERKDVTYNPSNDTISYDLRRWYKFRPDRSAHGLDFEVTLLNQLAASAAYKSKELNYFLRKSTSLTLSSFSSIAFTKTVGEFLFEGIQDSLLDLIRKFPVGDLKIPDKFGYFYGRNGSSDGLFNIGTGRNRKIGMLYNWNGDKSTKYYKKSCRKINGAAMDFYTDNMQNDKIEIFNPSFCRKMPLDFAGRSQVRGIEGFRYEADVSLLDNGTLIPGNECYCDDQCIRSGAISVTMCKGRANSYATLPHFLKADPWYATRVDGMKPDPTKHQFQIIVEPTTGILLKMNANLQLNVYLEPIEDIRLFENAPTLLFPVMRFCQSFTIPEYGAFSIGILLSLKAVIICIGVVISIIGMLMYMLFVFELRRGKSFISDDDRYGFPEEMNPLKEKHGNG